MSAEAVSAFIDELKSLLWAASDDELASSLKVGKSTIASWRRRGSVPAKIRRQIYFKYKIDYDLIATGTPCRDAQSSHLFLTAVYAAIMKLAKQAQEAEIEEIASWLALHEADFRAHLIDPVAFHVADPFTTEAYERMLKQVLTGDLASLEAFRRLQNEVRADEARMEGGG